jgi:hypothetical protein
MGFLWKLVGIEWMNVFEWWKAADSWMRAINRLLQHLEEHGQEEEQEEE